MSYPTDVKVFIDDTDITKWFFGEDTITLDDSNNTWRNIDITPFVRDQGYHKVIVTAGGVPSPAPVQPAGKVKMRSVPPLHVQ